MLPSLLITFREILEASLIVATILGILTKLGHQKMRRTVSMAAVSALTLSLLLLIGGSVLGLRVHEQFTGITEQLFEGSIMIISAFFITWAVFFLHKTFAHYKLSLLQKVRTTMETNQKRAIFLLVFTAVFREGFEIILFLSTLFFSSNPVSIGSGFLLGSVIALGISYLLFNTTLKLPVFYAFRLSSLLLILFAAGMVAQGYHELVEAGIFAELTIIPELTFRFLPAATTTWGSLVKTLFGLTQTMSGVEFSLWAGYTLLMTWIIFLRPSFKENSSS